MPQAENRHTEPPSRIFRPQFANLVLVAKLDTTRAPLLDVNRTPDTAKSWCQDGGAAVCDATVAVAQIGNSMNRAA